MDQVQQRYAVSERRACELIGVGRSTIRYKSVANDWADLRLRIRDLATSRPRYGYRRLLVLLHREGVPLNHKLMYRLYCEESLGIRRKRVRRRRAAQVRQERQVAADRNEIWSMDFMSDELFASGRIRLLTLVDNFSRESLAIEIGKRMTGDDLVRILEGVCHHRGYPKTIRVDNGPEFISKSLDLWAYCKKVQLDFSRPGKPTDNAFIESFNGKFRSECLDQHWFLSLEEASKIIEAWRYDYNHSRPHSALGNVSPVEFKGPPASGLARLPATLKN